MRPKDVGNKGELPAFFFAAQYNKTPGPSFTAYDCFDCSTAVSKWG